MFAMSHTPERRNMQVEEDLLRYNKMRMRVSGIKTSILAFINGSSNHSSYYRILLVLSSTVLKDFQFY
jgi:hypothetical protein